MIKGIYVAAGGMIPRDVQMSNIANNLANVTTNGYKKSSVFLRKLIGAEYALDRAQGLERQQLPEELSIDYSQGTFDKTDNTFDIALNGNGFFRVRDAQGAVNYTRDGRFSIDPNGFMINNTGMFLLNDRNNNIQIDGTDVEIKGDGVIFVDGLEEDTIGLADFNPGDYQSLTNIGRGMFVKPATVFEMPSNPGTKLLQGFLEASNVDQVKTMVDMIELFREFELGQKSIQIQDQSLQRIVAEVGSMK